MSSQPAQATADWTIRWAEFQDLPAIQQYIATYWSPGHLLARDAEFLRWQFVSPRPNQLEIVLAERGSVLGGILGVIDADWIEAQQRGRGAWLSTWSVAPEYRQFGLALRLQEFVTKQDYQLIGTVGANAAALQLYRLQKYQIVPAMPRSVRLFSYELLGELLNAFPAVDRAAYEQFWKSHAQPIQSPAGTPASDREPTSLLEQWDQVWQREFVPRLFSLDRGAAYLRRRYLKHPRFDYKLFFAQGSDGQPSGYCVYRLAAIEPSPLRMMRVVEYLATDEMAYAQLGAQLESVAQAANCVYADFSCTLQASHDGLPRFTVEQAGDAVLPKRLAPAEFGKTGTSACWLPLASPRKQLDVANAVYLTSGDCDQDRPN